MKDKIKKEKIREDTTSFTSEGNCCGNMLEYTEQHKNNNGIGE